MNMKRLIILAFFITVPLIRASSQEDSPKQLPRDNESRLTIPLTIREKHSSTAVSILFTRLPFDWVENEIEMPLFRVENRYHVTKGLVIESAIQTVIISNQLRTGPHYYFGNGKISFGAGADLEFMYGMMKIAGFNNKCSGMGIYPGFSAGYAFSKSTLVLKGEALLINSVKMTSGNEEIIHLRNRFSGVSFSLLSEQPLWKNRYMIVGFTFNYQKFFYPAWPSFSTFDRYYFIPQFTASFVL